MKNFKLVGQESVLTLHLAQPLHLEDGNYKIALTGFYSDNNIANLKSDGKIYFCVERLEEGQVNKNISSLTLEPGFWTIEKIQNKCRQYITSLTAGVDANKFMVAKYTDRIAIYSPIQFYLDPVISNLLGFEPKSNSNDVKNYHNVAETVVGKYTPKLRAVDVIEIHCNLVEHSFVNHDTHWHKHDETEILYHFFPNIPNGYKISQEPQEKFYVPLKSSVKTIREIRVVIKDQDNQLLQNQGVNNIVYLNLVKV